MKPLRAVIVDEGETLWSIATRELGDAWRWKLLAAVNHLSDPDLIFPGDIIVTDAVVVPYQPRRHAW